MRKSTEFSKNIILYLGIFGTIIGLLDVLVNYFKEIIIMAIIFSVVLILILLLFFYLIIMRVSIIPEIKVAQNRNVAILAIEELIKETEDEINKEKDKKS